MKLVTMKIGNIELKVGEDGNIDRKMCSHRWKPIINKVNHTKGYNVITLGSVQFMRSKIIAHAFHLQHIYDDSHFIGYKDANKLNCSVNNLRIGSK